MVETAGNVNLFVLIAHAFPAESRVPMIIQIYEIQTPSEARAMIDLGVDHVGSVLVSEQRWRDETLRAVVSAVQAAGRKSSIIPLFGRVDTISRVVEYYRPDILHFCETLPGGEHENGKLEKILQRQQTIAQRHPEVALMRSIPIGRSGGSAPLDSLAMARLFEPCSDWFLTDTLLESDGAAVDQDQPVTGFVGITGQTCDWHIARQLVEQSRIPVILAGGIGPGNVAEGISHVRPAGVDSCTLTNAVDQAGRALRFQKDFQKVRQLIDNARNKA